MTTAADLVGADGLIDVGRFPYRSFSLGVEWVAQQADLARKLAVRTQNVTSQVHGVWGSMGAYYDAPEAQALLGKMSAVKTGGDDEHEELLAGARHMDRWVEDVSSCKQQLENVERETVDLRRSLAMQGRDWTSTTFAASEDPQASRLVAEHDALLARARSVMEQLRVADEELARQLHGRGHGPAHGFGMSGGIGQQFPTLPGSAGFVPDRKWLRDASPREVLEWWNGLPPWKQELMADAIDESDLPHEVRERMVSEALASAGAAGAEPQDGAALVLATNLFGDRQVMADAVENAGGHVVAAAMSTIGASAMDRRDVAGYAASAYAALAAVRSGVVSASRRWDQQGQAGQAKATEFAQGMMDSVGTRRDGSPVAFLFSGEELVGQELTVAMSDELDLWERGTGVVPRQPGIGFVTEQGGGGEELWREENMLVFSTLAQYPDAALEWLTAKDTDPLTGSALGEERVAHYFSEVATRRNGRFETMADLWSGAQHAEGSLLAGGGDEATQVLVAELSTSIFEQLAENEGLVLERLTPKAAQHLAEAVMPQLPQFAVNGVTGDPTGQPHAMVKLVSGDGKVPVVNATKAELAKVLGPILAQEAGMAVASSEVEAFHAQVMASFGSTGPLESSENADLMFQVDGALEGARLVAASEAALRADEATGKGVGTAKSVLGFAASKTPVPKFAVDWTLEKATAFAKDHLATKVEEVHEAELARLAALAEPLTQASHDAYEAYVREHGEQTLSREDFARNNNTVFSDTYGAWINLAEQKGDSGT